MDKYSPIRFENKIPNLDRLTSKLLEARELPGYGYSQDRITKEHLGNDHPYRLSAIHSYMKFFDCGRNIFDFSKDLIEMLANTDVSDTKFSDFKFPYDSFYISFLDAQISFQDDSILDGAYISLTDYGDDPLVKFDIWIELCSHNESVIKQKSEFTDKSSDPAYLASGLSFQHENSSVKDALDFQKQLMTDETDPRHLDIQLEEYKLLIDHLELVVNSLLYISTPNPDISNILTQSEPATKHTAFSNSTTKDRSDKLSKVRLVGYSYSTNSKNGASTRTLKSHWRRGHWRNQKYGHKDSVLTKLIWIKPTLVGDDSEPSTGRIYET